MANPQPDNFTRISNELMENIPLYKFNGTQLRIIVVILRYTYGFSRKQHTMSLTFLSKATNIHKAQIKREISTLINKKVIIVKKAADFNSARVLEFNKNYDEWLIETSMFQNTQVANSLTGSEKDSSQVANSHTPTGSELVYQERKNKEKINKEQNEFFESIWKLYPNKKGKGQVSKTQISKLYKIGFETLRKCIDRYKATKEDWKAWQQGSTFFNSGYIDYLDENYTEEEKGGPQYADLTGIGLV